MSPEPIYLRFENTSPPYRKFYEVDVELSLFYPKRWARRWGGIGSCRPRSILPRAAFRQPSPQGIRGFRLNGPSPPATSGQVRMPSPLGRQV